MESHNPTPQQLEEYKETFALFDRTGEGKVPLSSIGTLLRALGQNPTESELKEIVSSCLGSDAISPEDKLVDFDQFLKILLRPGGFRQDTDATVKEFIQAFQVFDRDGSGFISVGELRYVLTSLGDRLSDAEVDELLKAFDTDGQENINYEELVKLLTS
ncbi:hypothetical protein BB560_003169, partial [Smittium megazygosporum]